MSNAADQGKMLSNRNIIKVEMWNFVHVHSIVLYTPSEIIEIEGNDIHTIIWALFRPEVLIRMCVTMRVCLSATRGRCPTRKCPFLIVEIVQRFLFFLQRAILHVWLMYNIGEKRPLLFCVNRAVCASGGVFTNSQGKKEAEGQWSDGDQLFPCLLAHTPPLDMKACLRVIKAILDQLWY